MEVGINFFIYNLERGEIEGAVHQVKKHHEHKFGCNSWYEVYEKANIEFFDKLKNNTKNVWVEGRRVAYCARRREIASKRRFGMIKANKLIITIVGEIRKNITNTCLKLQIPMLWRHFFKHIANNRDYVYIFCNRPLYKFDRHCREWYLYNLIKNNTGDDGDDIRMLDDGMNNYALHINYSLSILVGPITMVMVLLSS